jgi:hypothetical protein
MSIQWDASKGLDMSKYEEPPVSSQRVLKFGYDASRISVSGFKRQDRLKLQRILPHQRVVSARQTQFGWCMTRG